MRNIFAIVKNELKRYFCSPLAYIIIVSFLVMAGLCTFYLGNFFAIGEANLKPFFKYHAWIYLFFVPAIAMRLWAEEFRSGSVIQLLTLPINVFDAVLGKFLAAWVFGICALALTFPIWVSVNILGEPDNPVIALGYLGSILMMGAFLAIGSCMSSVTKNQVVALILAGVVSFVFVMSGLDMVLNFIRGWMPDFIVETIASFSFLTHFASIYSGVVDVRDVLFFVSVIVLFLAANISIVNLRSSEVSSLIGGASKPLSAMVVAVSAFVLFMSVNIFANNAFRSVRVDATQNKIYTLSENSVKLINGLKDDINVKVFYSKSIDERNPLYAEFLDKLTVMLRQLSDISKGKLHYKIYDPIALSVAEDRAIAFGVKKLPLVDVNEAVYFGVVAQNSADDTAVIPFLSLDKEKDLEYEITKLIYKINDVHKKKIGFISSEKVYGTKVVGEVRDGWVIGSLIDEFYDVSVLSDSAEIPNDIDVLLIYNAKNIPEKTQLAIDQYMLKGGRALVFSDAAPEHEYFVEAKQGEMQKTELNELLNAWGIDFHGDWVVGDFDASTQVEASSTKSNNLVITQDVTRMKMGRSNFNTTQKVMTNINYLYLVTSGIITKPQNSTTKFVPLIFTSENSMPISQDVIASRVNPSVILEHFTSMNSRYVVAAMVEGAYISPFTKKEGANISRSTKPMKAIVIGDSDMIYDNSWQVTRYISDTNVVMPFNNNADFMLNCLDYLLDSDVFMGLRGRSVEKRPFLLVEKKRREADKQFRNEESELLEEIANLKSQYRALWGSAEVGDEKIVTESDRELIENIRVQMEELRSKLREVRVKLKRDIEDVQSKLKLFNIVFVPLLIIIISFSAFLLKKIKIYVVRSKELKTSHFRIRDIVSNKPLLVFVGVAILFSVAAMSSVYIRAKDNVILFEGKPLIANLAEKLNDIGELEIASSDKKIILEKEGLYWRISGKDGYPARQDRVRRLLLELTRAVIIEKKTSNPTKLNFLQLASADNKEYGGTEVKLKSKDGSVIADIIVGKEGLGLGRGAASYYVRYVESAQAWLLEANLSDISSDWKKWVEDKVINIDVKSIAKISFKNSGVTITRKNLPQAFFETGQTKLKFNQIELVKFIEEATQFSIENVRKINLLPKNKQLACELVDFDGVKVKIWLYQDEDKGYWYSVSMSDYGATVEYNNADYMSKDWAYKPSKAMLDALLKSRSELVK